MEDIKTLNLRKLELQRRNTKLRLDRQYFLSRGWTALVPGIDAEIQANREHIESLERREELAFNCRC